MNFVFPTLFICGAAALVWTAIDTLFLREELPFTPYEMRLRITEVTIGTSSEGRAVLGATLTEQDVYLPYVFKYRIYDGDGSSLVRYFGKDFARTQFSYGEEFSAICPRIRVRYLLLPSEVYINKPCSIKKIQ